MDKTFKKLEIYRILNIIFTVIFFVGFVATIVVALVGNFAKLFETIYCLIPFAGCIIGGILLFVFQKQFKSLYSNTLIFECVHDMFDGTTFDYNAGYNKEDIAITNMVIMGNQFNSWSRLGGSYRGINFTAASVDVAQKHEQTTSSNSSSISTYFMGPWLTIDLSNKYAVGNVTCFTKMFHSPKNLLTAVEFKFKKSKDKLDAKSIEFLDTFNVRGDNQEYADQVLTYDLMRYMVDLKDNNKFYAMSFGFINNKFYLAIDSKNDFFPIKVTRKIKPDRERELIREKGQMIKDLIDILEPKQ